LVIFPIYHFQPPGIIIICGRESSLEGPTLTCYPWPWSSVGPHSLRGPGSPFPELPTVGSAFSARPQVPLLGATCLSGLMPFYEGKMGYSARAHLSMLGPPSRGGPRSPFSELPDGLVRSSRSSVIQQERHWLYSKSQPGPICAIPISF
jgi:hypothetical protein